MPAGQRHGIDSLWQALLTCIQLSAAPAIASAYNGKLGTCMQQAKSLTHTYAMSEEVRGHVECSSMFCCWAQSEAGAGAAGQVAWAVKPQRAAILSPVRSLLQQAGCRCEEWHYPPGAALLRHAPMVLRRQGGFPLRLTPMAILTAWLIDVYVLGLCGHSLPSNHDP